MAFHTWVGFPTFPFDAEYMLYNRATITALLVECTVSQSHNKEDLEEISSSLYSIRAGVKSQRGCILPISVARYFADDLLDRCVGCDKRGFRCRARCRVAS